MKFRILFSLLIFSGFLSSCIKLGSTFSGISETSITGELISGDSDDWNFDDVWTRQESSLFDIKRDETCDQNFRLQACAYPNPCTDVFYIYFPASDSVRIDVRIVNNDYDVLYSADSVGRQLYLQTDSLGVDKEIIRVYYKVISGDCEFRGHGDILINED